MSKSFVGAGGVVELLRDADLVVVAGSTVAIMGRSGSGKSTLLRSLGLFQPFDEGSYRLLGRNVRGLSDRHCSALRARHIGFVFQEFRLLPNLDALANVECAGALAGVPWRERRKAAERALEAVGMSNRRRATSRTLSGGEQQRVALARALVKSPSVVLADEPTGALDEETASSVLSVLEEAAATSGAALVVVTHDRDVARRCERVLHLQHGALVEPAWSEPG